MEQAKPARQPTMEEKEKLYQTIGKNAAASGYFLNPDKDYVLVLMQGLLVNQGRYGYPSCPCRLSAGDIDRDRDVICPCDYRDADLTEYGACYCALYVSKEIAEGKKAAVSIPERRNAPGRPDNTAHGGQETHSAACLPAGSPRLPVWRCRVCGYLCARENPPEICPICKAGNERFERFL